MSGYTIKLQEAEMQRVRALKEMLDKQQMPAATIQELAAEAGMNRTKLQYGFKQLFGTSIYAYQLQLRLEKAKKLLEDSDRTVKKIALLSGYTTISSFSAAFRKAFQLSPSQWRDKHQRR